MKTSTRSLTLRKTIRATPERVFDAWTKPALVKKWFKTEPDMQVPLAMNTLKVGGTYRYEMRTQKKSELKGATIGHSGFYKVIDRPKKLVFTWKSEFTDGETLVTIHFKKIDEGTEMTLIHTGFRSKPARDAHEWGWTGCLKSLAKLVS